MKTIGLIGGMSWESSAVYYRLLNEAVKMERGDLHSAKCLLFSVDFAEIAHLQHQGEWTELGAEMVRAAQRLESAGAEMIVLCTNTMHKVAEEIEAQVPLPFIHIADATAHSIKASGLTRVGLLATRFTMEEEFYTGRLRDKHGLDVLIPSEEDREAVHAIIYKELCQGVIREESKGRYLEVIRRLIEQGAEGIILGCTEIGLLIGQEDCAVPVFDTTKIHAEAAVRYALGA
ncbi:aspartate/glutamate racemase family protein [Brevibacillus ruminantium]|uniref:Aspartate/glutamate racemase family protein n=1 Tax=Brevibacillus ruminantium TaxID=2950604 RepID=A0ABY4WIV2_9BACL|nr:aspartate/glutamate racemase family protein [Brevibacillus ruminantium]USG66978.1 aspartate/glutamate racemase family protein [Brevibacillus ruminantium]